MRVVVCCSNVCTFVRQLEEVEAKLLSDGASSHCYTKVENFDTDLQTCLSDPKKALAYQTGQFCLCGFVCIN